VGRRVVVGVGLTVDTGVGVRVLVAVVEGKIVAVALFPGVTVTLAVAGRSTAELPRERMNQAIPPIRDRMSAPRKI